MSHPFMWPNRAYYYPIGNTAPVCLTESLPPEENAKILLLGCGDPRSILYTLRSSINSSSEPRSLDFTCCDIEPAIIARNVLLFTLIVDGSPTNRIWNIFYHFKVDQASLSLIGEQCEKLVSVSGDLDSWYKSPYSAFLRICSCGTLAQLNRHWKLYAQATQFSKQKNDAILAMFLREYQNNFGTKNAIIISASRSAGPFMMDVTKIQSTHFEHYWRTGTVFPDAVDIASAKFVNPTFIYSVKGEGCHVHYGSYPLQCFHLLAAFVPENKSGKTVTINDLFTCAQSQFQDWCDAFQAAVVPSSRAPATIRLFVGDAIAFCHTLRQCNATSSTSACEFVSAFSAAELVLDGGDYGTRVFQAAPTAFNVIDTSNVTDHVGLLNVLITTVPLLIQGPSSTLYTESLLVGPEGNRLKTFIQRLCTDIPTISLLFGVAPVDYLSGFNSHSNVHEIILSQIYDKNNNKQYHERIAWKIPYLGDANIIGQRHQGMLHPTFEPLELAKLLFDIYHHMFQHEDLMKTTKDPYLKANIIHYDRGTFAALLGVIKSRVHTDWQLVMEHIFDMLHNDKKLILGSNFYQDLCCQLHMRGVFTVEIYREPHTAEWTKVRVYRGWKRIPPMVCLLLVVPRAKVKILDQTDAGTPILQCDFRSQSFHNKFSTIQLVFGTLTIEGSGSDARATVKEDTEGMCGSSDLVLSVWIPAYCFVVADSKKTQIGLGVQGTPVMTKAFMEKLGLMMTVFTANLEDRNHVHVLAQGPYFSERTIPEPSSPTSTHKRVSVAVRDLKISTLTAKWEIGDLALNDIQGDVQSQQVSPCVMKVTLGRASKLLAYPFPINGKESRLRVARKSGWIEVVVPLSGHRQPGGFSIRNFPLIPCGGRVLTAWNIHRLNLERLPTYDPRKHDTKWVESHLLLGMSDRELDLRAAKVSPSVDVFIHVKETIRAIFHRAIELNGHGVISLSDNGHAHTIIFLNRLCLDLASTTLVADACILPLTDQFMDRHQQVIANLTSDGMIMSIVTKGEEVTAWKHLLPAFVDRCRTWSHKPMCQYTETGEIPLAVDFAQNPMCACGEGGGLGPFGEVAKWKVLAPYVTRAAISQLFAVSYLESVARAAMDHAKQAKRGNAGGNIGSIDMDVASCARCGKSAGEAGGKLMRCVRCMKTMYCGKACQSIDWPQHKVGCRK